jgi:hypothetical protein
MATNSLIQYLEQGDEGAVSNRREVETFIANGTIAAGDAVSFDLTATDAADRALLVVAGQAFGTTPAKSCFVGVALSDASAGDKVDVVIKGLAYANVDGATVQGNALELGVTAGRLAVYANTSVDTIAGKATEADTANKAWIIVKKQF